MKEIGISVENSASEIITGFPSSCGGCLRIAVEAHVRAAIRSSKAAIVCVSRTADAFDGENRRADMARIARATRVGGKVLRMGAFTWFIKQGWLVGMATKEDYARRPPLYFRHHPYFAQARIPILAIVCLFLRSPLIPYPWPGLIRRGHAASRLRRGPSATPACYAHRQDTERHADFR